MTEAVEDVGTNALEPTPVPIVENVDSTQVPETTETEVVEIPAETPPESPKDHGNKGKTPWYMQRLSEEANRRQQVETQLEQERREKNEARALLERIQGGDKDLTKSTNQDTDIDALVEARAEQKLFNADCNSVAERGAIEIEGFNDKLGVLRSIGVVNDEFLKDIFAVDKAGAHKILDYLAQDPEKANLMTRLDSRKRIAELTRISDKMTEPVKIVAPVPRVAVSRVPAPKPVLDAVADDSGDADLTNDKLDDQTWSKLWDKKYKKRA